MGHLHDMEATFEVEMAEIMELRKNSIERRMRRHYRKVLRLSKLSKSNRISGRRQSEESQESSSHCSSDHSHRDSHHPIPYDDDPQHVIESHNHKLGRIQRKYKRRICKLLERNSRDIAQIQGDFHRQMIGTLDDTVDTVQQQSVPYKKKRKKRPMTGHNTNGNNTLTLPPLPFELHASLHNGVKAAVNGLNVDLNGDLNGDQHHDLLNGTNNDNQTANGQCLSSSSTPMDDDVHERHAALLRDLRDLEDLRGRHGDDTEVDSIPTPDPKPLIEDVPVPQKKKKKKREKKKRKSRRRKREKAKFKKNTD